MLLFLVGVAQSSPAPQPVPQGYHRADVVARVNAPNSSAGWVAGRNAYWAGWDEAGVKRMLLDTSTVASTNRSVRNDAFLAHKLQAGGSFDARAQWPSCTSISQIWDQGQCGSCWAFGATTAFTDRYCIATNQRQNPTMSVETTLSCSMSDGCAGGSIAAAWDYFYTDGLPTDGCDPYQPPACPASGYGHNPCWGPPLPGSSTSHPTPQCSRAVCKSGSGVPTVYKTTAPHYTLDGDFAVMIDVQTHGPLSACFVVYDDFLHYKSGVYTKTAGSAVIGGHCVRLLGWGEDASKPYWLVANEWSKDWGEGGFFRISRGQGDGAGCQFLTYGVAGGLPQVQL